MKLISWNVNGIRAVEKKGELQKLVSDEQPDVLFLQEIKAKEEQLGKWLTENEDYAQFYHSAEKPGYSGVGVWLKKSSIQKFEIETGMPGWNDSEGRVISFRTGNKKQYKVYGVYFPNGGKSPEAWQGKLKFYDHFHEMISKDRSNGDKVIFTGDLNVAHNEIDLARPKENEKNIGFLPEERAWVDRLQKDNWIDTFRSKHPDEISYTWWNMQTRSRDRNIGWRIDYFIVDKPLFKNVQKISHLNDQMGSDHCPVVLEVELPGF
ncbi:MAG: exodeoxyribonuclease III [Leptospiraceae bacterium]|nr:exodeoxyribonuclease III [Leptospiraceae bacterium]